jgi:hypothetical protein
MALHRSPAKQQSGCTDESAEPAHDLDDWFSETGQQGEQTMRETITQNVHSSNSLVAQQRSSTSEVEWRINQIGCWQGRSTWACKPCRHKLPSSGVSRSHDYW